MRGFSKILLCIAMILGLGGLTTVSADASTSRHLTLTFSTKTPNAHTLVTVHGSINHSAKGTTVTIQRKSGSKWKTAKSTKTTTTAGAYSTSLTVSSSRGSYSYRASVAKHGNLKAATSSTVKVSVRTVQKVTLSAKSEIAIGSSVTLTGGVSPFKSKAKVTILSRAKSTGPGAFHSVGTATLSSKGKYSFTAHPAADADYEVSVPVQSTSYLAAGTSTMRSVTVIHLSNIQTNVPNAQVNTPYLAHLTTSEDRAGTWAKIGTWPNWLILNTSTGTLTGTAPAAPGPIAVKVTFKDTALPTLITAPTDVTFNVQPLAPLSITTATLGTGRVGVPFSATTLALNVSNPPGTWSQTGLPAGLVLNAATGVITGTPTAAAVTYPSTTNPSFTFTPTTGSAAIQAIPITILAARPVISTATLPQGTVGNLYTATLATTGNKVGTWTLTGDTLPTGLSFNTATGAFTGTPAAGQNGAYAINAQFHETATTENSLAKSFTLTIGQATAPSITTNSLPDATVGTAYSASINVVGSPTGSWTAVTLGNGLSFNASTGAITGTPTTAGTITKTYTFTQTSTGLTASKSLLITINAIPVAITTTSLPDGALDSPYSQQLTATGGSGTWSKTSGSLPAGLTLTSGGLISGKPGPTADGSASFNIKFTSGAVSDTESFSINVEKFIASAGIPAGTVGVAYSFQLQQNGSGPGTWSSPFGSSLDGLTLHANGLIDGTPTSAVTTFWPIEFDPATAGFTTEDFTADVNIEGSLGAGPAATSVSAGNEYACRIKEPGDTLWCWGHNFKGNLGSSTTLGGNATVPAQVSGAWKQVSAGAFYHTCGVKTAGTLWCWGYNNAGQLGNGSSSDEDIPAQVVGGGTTWKQVSTGTDHSCATKTDGTLWCWGQNSNNQLGGASPNSQALTPAQVGSDTHWSTVTAGAGGQSCALKDDNSLWCWGSNFRGQVGSGSSATTVAAPAHIGADTWIAVSAGNAYTCGIKTGGALYCWGAAEQGRLGNDTTTGDVNAPAHIGSATWKTVAAGGAANFGTTCGIQTDGTGWCWGYNGSGQLGNGSFDDSNSPTQVDTTTSWSSVSVGANFACGVKNDESQRCWGNGGHGEMGDGSTFPFDNPIPVIVN
jgi:hypothetical protein